MGDLGAEDRMPINGNRRTSLLDEDTYCGAITVSIYAAEQKPAGQSAPLFKVQEEVGIASLKCGTAKQRWTSPV